MVSCKPPINSVICLLLANAFFISCFRAPSQLNSLGKWLYNCWTNTHIKPTNKFTLSAFLWAYMWTCITFDYIKDYLYDTIVPYGVQGNDLIAYPVLLLQFFSLCLIQSHYWIVFFLSLTHIIVPSPSLHFFCNRYWQTNIFPHIYTFPVYLTWMFLDCRKLSYEVKVLNTEPPYCLFSAL